VKTDASRRPPLILIPGLLCDDTVWRAQIDAFSATHEVIVPELDETKPSLTPREKPG